MLEDVRPRVQTKGLNLPSTFVYVRKKGLWGCRESPNSTTVNKSF